jgi:hypothetical protein
MLQSIITEELGIGRRGSVACIQQVGAERDKQRFASPALVQVYWTAVCVKLFTVNCWVVPSVVLISKP